MGQIKTRNNKRSYLKKEKYLLEVTKEQCVLLRSIAYQCDLTNSTYEPLRDLVKKLDKVIGHGPQTVANYISSLPRNH